MKIISVLLLTTLSTVSFAVDAPQQSNSITSINVNDPNLQGTVQVYPNINTHTGSATGTYTIQGNGYGTGSGQDTGIGGSAAAETNTKY